MSVKDVGRSTGTARDLLGHGSIVTTDRYINVPRRALFDAVTNAFNGNKSVSYADTRHKNVTDSTGFERISAGIAIQKS